MTDSLQVPASPVSPSVWTNPWHNLAFGLGSGTLPKAPGTWGSLVALAFVPLLQALSPWLYGALLVVAAVFGCWLCGKVARDLGVHDHEGIVWDEFVGIWITLFLAPPGLGWLLLGFVAFRVLDIAKPWPIRWADRHVEGGLGIMLDDLLAGIGAWGVVQGVAWVV